MECLCHNFAAWCVISALAREQRVSAAQAPLRAALAEARASAQKVRTRGAGACDGGVQGGTELY